MLAGGISEFAKEIIKNSEIAIKASEVAELGAVKPDGFGSLIKQRFSFETAQKQIDGVYSMEFPHINMRNNLFGIHEKKENPYLSLRYNEVSKECSEYLCDYGITPMAWLQANLEQRMSMIKKAAQIMAEELRLPKEWANAIEPTAVSGKDYTAEASCRVGILDNGGVDIVGIPTLKVNTDCLTNDYFEAMSTIYHEMIHIKQYASIDCIDPEPTTDSRLLDLINDLKADNGDYSSNVSYLYSPYEAEAWAQESYFIKMLQAVVQERYMY